MTRTNQSNMVCDITASTAVETAMVLGILMPLLLGSLELGLMMWTQDTLQSIAALTARCVAIGSPACSNSPQYAVNLAKTWLGSAMITTSNVTIAAASTCNSVSGTFEVVTISASPWVGSIVYPLAGRTQTVTACYPT